MHRPRRRAPARRSLLWPTCRKGSTASRLPGTGSRHKTSFLLNFHCWPGPPREPSSPMVVAYVRIHATHRPQRHGSQRIYALLLPSADGRCEWHELSVRPSATHGEGVFPRQAAIDWRNLDMPVLLPYLGVETVVNDDHSRKVLLEALRGNFEEVSVAEVEAANGVARHRRSK